MTNKTRLVSWCSALMWGTVALGGLGGCGPVENTEPVVAQAPERSSPLPFDVNDVIRRAREGMPSVQPADASVSPEIPVSSSPWREISPAVAAGNGIYLVVWAELLPVDSSSSNPDIWAARVRASDGALLDSVPIRIAEGPAAQFRPAVAFDGSNFLVVWNHLHNEPPRVHGARVRASDGAVLDTPFLISRVDSPYFSQLPEYNPSVAFDGTNYLVVWEGWYVQYDINYYAVFGARVRASDAQLVDPYGFVIGRHPSTPPQVAYGQGRYLVAWAGNQGTQSKSDVFGVRIDAVSRNILDATPLRFTSTPEDEAAPAVASSGSQFLVVWGSPDNHIRGARVRGSDGVLLDGASFDVGAAGFASASAAFDGQDYRVAWQGTRDGARKLLSARVSPTTGMVAGSELVLSPVASGSELVAPGIAATAAGHFAVAYNTSDRIKLRRVEDVIEDCSQLGPVLSINGGAEMTLECKVGGTYSDPGAQAWDGCGNPIEVHAYNTGKDASGPGPNLSYEGSYTVSYSAWDSTGRTVDAARTVHVDDRTAPTLKLLGSAFMTHQCNTQWKDPWVEATDACYGDISSWAQRSGEVNAWAEGTYTVTYTVTDGGGNTSAPVTRTVEVVDCPW